MAGQRHRLYVRLHKRLPDALPLSFPFHISFLLCKKTLDDTRSAVTFYLTKAPSKFYPAGDEGGQWRVEQRLINPQEETDVLAMFLVQKLSPEHEMRYYEDFIARCIAFCPILQNVDKYDCAVWAWNILNRMNQVGYPWDTVPQIVGTTTSQLEQEMVDAAMGCLARQRKHQMTPTMEICEDGTVVSIAGEGKIRRMLSIKRRGPTTSIDSMETLVNQADETVLVQKHQKRVSFQQLQAFEKDFRNRVDSRKPGPRKGWHEYWFPHPEGSP